MQTLLIHTDCVWFVWERGMQNQLSREFGPALFASLPEGSLWGEGSLHKAFPTVLVPLLLRRSTSALVGFVSDGGIGDERVSISVLTHQILWPLPEIGSPPYVYSGLGASSVFLRGGWWGEHRGCFERCLGWNRHSRSICPLTLRCLWRLWPCPPSRCVHL